MITVKYIKVSWDYGIKTFLAETNIDISVFYAIIQEKMEKEPL